MPAANSQAARPLVRPGTLQPQPLSSLLLLLGAGTQLLLVLQTLPAAQSSTLVHSVLHSPLEASHTYGAHRVLMLSSLIDERRSSEHLDPVGVHCESAQLKPAAQSRPLLHLVKHSLPPQA